MKRSILLIIHILSVVLVVAGFAVLHNYTIRGRGISWINSASFEESVRFSEMVGDDLMAIRRLAVLRNAFEEDAGPDNQNMLVSAESVNGSIIYTVGDVITLAGRFGFSLDPVTRSLTIGEPAGDANNYEIRVTYKAYDPFYFRNITPGPSQGVMTVRDMCLEAMRAMAEYYALDALYRSGQSNFAYAAYFETDSGEELVITNSGDITDNIGAYGKYLLVRNDGAVETNIEPQPRGIQSDGTTFEYSEVEEGYVLEIGVDTMYLYADRYQAAAYGYEGYISRAWRWAGALAAGALILLVTLVLLVRDQDVVKRGKAFAMDRLPIEGMIAIYAFTAVFLYGIFRGGLYNVMGVLAEEGSWNFWCTTVKSVIVYAFCVVILCSMYRRSYQGGVFSNSLILRGINALADDTTGSIWRVLLPYACFLVLNAVCIGAGVYCFSHRLLSRFYLFASVILFAFAAAVDIAAYVLLYGRNVQRTKINSALRRISDGEVEYTMEELEFSGAELEAARSINSISDGLSHAINEQVKADRLKADLITNVSHDIKTPLTSIINYVDLIRRENVDNEKIREYIDVLVRKSARLKNLTEDLVEASKASSGNVRLDMKKIDMSQLASQAAGEFDDKFSARNLEFNLALPEEPAWILADGRHLWRVFENLLNNAAKYSMEHTRIYAEVIREEGSCIFSIKNISQDKLNISPDELTERFIRGDVSRSTEGSGLGLSIAKSLTQLMGGKLVIEIDGDLYKARVVLPEYTGQEPEETEKSGTIEIA